MRPCLYIAIGDSITAGYGVRRGFVHFLAGRLREARPDLAWEVVNGGVSGDTVHDALQRLDDLLVRPPGLVTVNFGVNDAFSGVGPDRFAADLATLVDRIRRAGCERIVLLSSEALPVPEAERQVAPFWEAMRRTAKTSGAAYADAHGRWLAELAGGRKEEELLLPGDLHPGEEGHRLIAEAVFEAVESTGFLKTW